MIIKKMKLDDMNPAAYNPRLNLQPGDPEYEKIKRSIEEFGLVETLVWNKRTGNLVGGHQRLKVLKELGYTEADVSVVDLSEDKEKALNIALNKIQGDWDMPRLKDLLEELDTGDLDMELTGFGMEEIEDLMTQFHVPGEIIEDDVPEPPEEPITKPGNLWLLGRHRLLCGDSRDPMYVNKLLSGRQITLCATSPPYTDQRDYNIGEFDWHGLMCDVFDRIIENAAESCNILINLGLSHKDRRVDMYWDKWIEHAAAKGWPLFGWYVWDKGSGMPGEWNGRLAPAHEFVFHFNNKTASANKWIKTTGESAKRGASGKRFRQKDGTLRELTSPDKIGQPYKIPDSVIRIGREMARGIHTQAHPAVFSVEFAAFFLQTWAQEGDMVYEPFSGSGTMLVAAEQLNRICYMMEINPKYCDVTVQRWENLTGQKAVLAE